MEANASRLCSAILILWFIQLSGGAFAESFYASPTGSGTLCITTQPCSVDTALSKAGAGSELILLDGIYTRGLRTTQGGSSGHPVLIRAQNRHQAIFRKSIDRLAEIYHSYVTIRGIRFDGQRTGGSTGGVRIGMEEAPTIHDVIFEENIVENIRAACILLKRGPSKIVIRYNTIDGCGLTDYWGEGIYAGDNPPSTYFVRDVEIYGNLLRGFTEQGVDLHPYASDFWIHHNIFENQVTFEDYGGKPVEVNGLIRGVVNHGTISVSGYNSRVNDNILRNNKGGFGLFTAVTPNGSVIDNNVAYGNVGGLKDAIRGQSPNLSVIPAGLAKAEIANNSFCDLPTYNILNPENLNLNNNKMNAAQSVCDQEVARILAEVQALSGQNPAPEDTAAPTVSILSPADGTMVKR